MYRYLNNHIKLLLAVCCTLAHCSLWACGGISQRVYSGKIEYSLDTLNPLICNVAMTMDFDVYERPENDSIWVDWGDYAITTIHAASITEDSLASANIGSTRVYTHVYTGSHTYVSVPASGYYFISFQNEYRINGVNNIAGGGGINLPFYLMAQVSIDTTAIRRNTPLAFAPLSIGFAGLEPYSQPGLPQTNSAGDSIVYTFTPPLETISNPVPQYQLPDQFCIANGSAINTFSMDPITGNIAWTSPCLQGIYCFGTLLSRYQNGRLTSSIMREQNIYVSANATTDIQTIAGSHMQLYPNPTQNMLRGFVIIESAANETTVSVTAADGRIVIPDAMVSENKFGIDVSHLASGVYFILLRSRNEVLIEKFVKD